MEGIVIDTNVFVAAGFNPKSAAARVFEGVREGRFRLIWNEPTRRETEIIVRRIPRLDWASIADLFQPEAEFAGPVDLEAFTTISDPRRSKIRRAERSGKRTAHHQRWPRAGGRGRGRHRGPDATRFSGTKGRIWLVTGSSARRPTAELCSRSVTGGPLAERGSVGSAFSTGHRRTPLALVGHARGRRRVSVQAISCAAGDVAYSLPSRSWIRPARRWRCTAMPTWFGRSLGHSR